MLQKLKNSLLIGLALFGIGLTPVVVASSSVMAETTACDTSGGGVSDPRACACEGAGGTFTDGKCNSGKEGTNDLSAEIKSIVNILLFIIGIASVLMIVIGGIRYVVSGGDQNGTTGAKNTILYAVIGLVVAFMAYAIVNFVLGSL